MQHFPRTFPSDGIKNEFLPPPRNNNLFEISTLISDLYNIAVFYVFILALLPKYFNRKRLTIFLIYVGIFYIGFFLVKYLAHYFLFKGMKMPPMFFMGFSFLFVLVLSIAYSLISDRIRIEKEMQEKENANLKTELQFLRSQISPHFMFNVLNNMVAMARKRSDQLEPSLMELSGLMRYMLYEVKNDKVPLHKEIDFLKQYINLQQQRMQEGVNANFYLEDDPNLIFIEPMLLIPFVENAFKHSQSVIEPQIDIILILTKGKLSFIVKNKYDDVDCINRDKQQGIGFVNVKRRLQLLYGSKSDLQIIKTESQFQVQLHIEMQ